MLFTIRFPETQLKSTVHLQTTIHTYN